MQKIDIFDAELKVLDWANNESLANDYAQADIHNEQVHNGLPLEDRVYELAMDVVEKYIRRIEENYDILDIDGELVDKINGNEDGSMWYDEVRDQALRVVLERLWDEYPDIRWE